MPLCIIHLLLSYPASNSIMRVKCKRCGASRRPETILSNDGSGATYIWRCPQCNSFIRSEIGNEFKYANECRTEEMRRNVLEEDLAAYLTRRMVSSVLGGNYDILHNQYIQEQE